MKITAFTRWDLNQFTQAVVPVALTATGNTTGVAINQQALPTGILPTGFKLLGVVATLGTFGGTTPTFAVTPVVQDSPDGTNWTAVSDQAVLPANLLPGATAPYVMNAAGTWQFSLRLKGCNQYIRVLFQTVATGTTPTCEFAAVYCLSEPDNVY